VNKILALYDLEFKRIDKLYFSAIIAYIFLSLLGVLVQLYNAASNIAINIGSKTSLSLLSKVSAARMIRETTIYGIYNFNAIAFLVAMVVCTLYCFVIWYRDFYGKSKTIYTLFMLPSNRFNIYISKLILMVSLIYGIFIVHVLVWLLSIGVVTLLSSVTFSQINQILFTTMDYDMLNLMGYSGIGFFMIYVLGAIVFVSILFTGVIIQKSFNKIGIILGIVYIGVSMFINLLIFIKFAYSGKLLIYQSIFYIIITLISLTLSYLMINKKIYL